MEQYIETIKKLFSKEYTENLDENKSFFNENYTNRNTLSSPYRVIKRHLLDWEKQMPGTGLFQVQGWCAEENSYDDPENYEYPEDIFNEFFFIMTHLFDEEALTRYQNLLIPALYVDLKECIKWVHSKPDFIFLPDREKKEFYKFVEEMETRLSNRIKEWPCNSLEDALRDPQDIAWAY